MESTFVMVRQLRRTTWPNYTVIGPLPNSSSTSKIEDELQPLWDAVPDPFGRYTQQYTSLSKVKQIKAMDQDGVPVAEIAETVGVSRMTVYRHANKQGVQRTQEEKA